MNLCCINCFEDNILKDHIGEYGSKGECDFCGSENVHCIDPEDLADLFMPVINLYRIVEDFMPTYDLKHRDGEFIWEKLDQEWGIFAIEYAKQEELLHAMFPCRDPKEGDPQFLHSWVERESEYWGTDRETTDELNDRWNDFCKEIISENRFFPRNKIDLELLSELLSSQNYSLLPDETLYRARIAEKGKRIPPHKMGKPPAEKSIHGRANPRGIPYLYLASDPDTAIKEIRPHLNDKVSVGKFKSLESLRLVDLRNPKIESPFLHGENLEFLVVHLDYLRILGSEISKPVDKNDPELEYLPLQYLCEFIKNTGYDGVAYKSSMGEGYNLAIFDDRKLKCTRTTLYDVHICARKAETAGKKKNRTTLKLRRHPDKTLT
jgi:hypothetical protein